MSFSTFEDVFYTQRLLSKLHLRLSQSPSYLFSIKECTISNNSFWTSYLDPTLLLSQCKVGESQLRALTLNQVACFDDGSAFVLAQFCKNLEILKINRCDALTESGIIYLSEACKNLVEFSVRGNSITDAGVLSVLSSSNSSLESLSIHFCKNVSDKLLSKISANSPFLTNLSLHCCPSMTSEGFISLFSRSDMKLRHLDLFDMQLTDNVLQALSINSDQLQTLRLLDCTNISFEGVNSVTNNALRLEELHLSLLASPESSFYLETGVSNSDCFFMSNLSQLKSMSLSYFNLNDEKLENLLQRVPKLRSLDISGCTEISDHGIYSLVQSLRDLTTLRLDHCVLISDRGLIQLGLSLRGQLLEFHADGCNRLSIEGLYSLLQNCTNLKRMTISSARISPEELFELQGTYPHCKVNLLMK